MKKRRIFAGLLASAMLTGLCACGSKKTEQPAEAPASAAQEQGNSTAQIGRNVVTYTVEKEVYEDSRVHEDGTELMKYRFELPRLRAQLADGTAVSGELVAADPNEDLRRAWSVVTAFNTDMDAMLSTRMAYIKTVSEWAESDYENSLSGLGPWDEAYADEQTITVYQTDNLVSVCMQFYDFLGGAHPNNGYNTYNFDLTAGEMVTYADFLKDDEEFRRIVSDEILKEIRKQGIADGLFEDYEVYVRDLVCDDCYDDNGITFIFEEYSIGPHAVGSLMFDIPYGMIANLLNERGRTVLPIKPEDTVLADFYETRELWSCFNVCTMPTDSESAVISEDGHDYQRVAYKDITTMQRLKELLLSHVSDDAAEEWLESSTYREFNGALYVCGAGRGTNIELGDSTYEVELTDAGGTVIETTEHFDTTRYDGQTQEFAVDSYVVTEYPFALRDGHAVFSSFNCPL